MDQRAILDYRFGWRWLVRDTLCQSLFLSGFDSNETNFLKSIYGESSFTNTPDRAHAWLIQDGWQMPDKSIPTHVDCIVVKGGVTNIGYWQRHVRGWRVQCYALLPARSPRVVVPIGRGRFTVQGLRLYHPGRWYARMAVYIVGAFARIGVTFPLEKEQLMIARRDGEWDCRPCAMYLGNPEVNRKTLILQIPTDGSPDTVQKYGETNEARAALRQEYASLKALEITPVELQVPRVLSYVECPDSNTLSIEYRKRKWATSRKLRKSSICFLTQLSLLGRKQILMYEVLKPYRDLVAASALSNHAGFRKMWQSLEDCAEKGFHVLGHRCHGDFTPWNCSHTKKGFFVFDWEESRDWAPALFDCFYYAVAPYLLISGAFDPVKARRKGLRQGRSLALKIGIEEADVLTYWRLWLVIESVSDKKDLHAWFSLIQESVPK